MHFKSLKRTCLLLVAVLAFVLLQAAPAAASRPIFRSMIKSTGLVVTPLGDGKNSTGTCWVVDAKRRWVITCNHVIGQSKQTKVYFPLYDHGKVITSRGVYGKTKPVPGRVLAFNQTRDLALVELASLPEGVRALPLARKSPTPNEPVYLIGNSNINAGSLWKCRSGKVLRVGSMPHVTSSGKKRNGKWIKSSVLGTHGDSGGPLVNQRGKLIGVYASGGRNPSGKVLFGNAVDVSEVRAFLQRQRARADSRAAASTTK